MTMHALREVDNPKQKIFDNIDEVLETLDNEDIARVVEAYRELIMNKSSYKLETLEQEDINNLKKFLEVTPLSDLSTVQRLHLTNFHQTILSEN